MPVVTVENIDAPIRVGTPGKLGSNPAEEPKTAMIVRPIKAVRVHIGTAGPIVESRMIDQVGKAFAARQLGKAYPHSLRRERRAQPSDIGYPVKGIKKPGKARQQQPRIDAEPGQRRRQRRRYIPQPA